jgi:hypothetical protein
MATLSSLPSEVVSASCQLLRDEDLQSLCRVSKRCLKQAQPHLYGFVSLWSKRISSFLRTIITHPHLADLVRYLRISSLNSCATEGQDTEFFRNYLVGTVTHADIFWTNIIADSRKLSGVLIEVLLLKLIKLEDLDIHVDIDPEFMLVAAVSARPALPPSLKTVSLWVDDGGTGNLGVLHTILAASKVEKLSTEFVGLVQGISDHDLACYSFRHLELVACKLKKQELRRFLGRCYCLQTFNFNYFPVKVR